jgi:hypothetical protein
MTYGSTTMRRTIAVIATLALVAGSTVRAEAQNRRDRDRGIVELQREGVRGGFFIGGGLGAGSEQYKFSDEPNYSEKLTKPTGTLRLGGTPDPYVRLGAEVFGWSADQGDFTENFGALLGMIQFYPLKDGGLFLKGSAGIAASETDYLDPFVLDPSEEGFAWSVGAGYEFQLSRSLGIAPTIDLYQASFTKRNEPTLNERVLNLGVQVTFQTGGRRR